MKTRQAIPRMLELFEKYSVHVTWAGVGMLMHQDNESLLKNFPSQRPTYNNKELSAYTFMEEVGIGKNEDEDPFHCADSLIRKILHTKNQELGSHSFSGFYCNEAGQTVDKFRAYLNL